MWPWTTSRTSLVPINQVWNWDDDAFLIKLLWKLHEILHVKSKAHIKRVIIGSYYCCQYYTSVHRVQIRLEDKGLCCSLWFSIGPFFQQSSDHLYLKLFLLFPCWWEGGKIASLWCVRFPALEELSSWQVQRLSLSTGRIPATLRTSSPCSSFNYSISISPLVPMCPIHRWCHISAYPSGISGIPTAYL